MAYSMEKYNIKKTNLVVQARINRESAAKTRYNLYNSFRKKSLSSDSIYIIDNLGHLKHLKYIFKNEDVGFFYRDNIWLMVMSEKHRMNENDKKAFNSIKPKLLELNESKNLNFKDNDVYNGFGWSHNSGKVGIWSEGPNSTLFFRTEKVYGDTKLMIVCTPYINKKNVFSEFDIYLNDLFYQNIKLENRGADETIEILIGK